MVRRYLMIIAGTLCVTLGTIGVIVPLLPTTPFLLLAAYLFSKSSETFHRRLLANKLLGNYIYNYSKRRGLIIRDKIISLVTLWGGIAFSFMKMSNVYGRTFLIVVVFSVTYHLVSLETLRD